MSASEWEEWAPRANSLLRSLQAELEERVEPIRPIIHVVGPPRSGTTLAMQLLAACTDLGYIDNTAAAFWDAPAYGVLFSRHLNHRVRRSTWQSTHGRTQDPTEPHEFGRFWLGLLGYRSMRFDDRSGDPIDWTAVRRTLASITTASGGPVAFKSFVAGWHLSDFQNYVGPIGVIRLHRDPLDVSMSILRLREHRLGRRDQWFSIRPPAPLQLEALPPAEQVAGQVFYTECELDRQTALLPSEHVVDIDYATLCERPTHFLDSSLALLNTLGADVRQTSRPPAFAASKADSTDPDYELVQDAVRSLPRLHARASSDARTLT